MRHESVTISVNREEWALIAALRDLPNTRARQLATQIIQEVLEVAGAPHCAELQADGAPCPTANNDCAQCVCLEDALAALHGALVKGGSLSRSG